MLSTADRATGRDNLTEKSPGGRDKLAESGLSPAAIRVPVLAVAIVFFFAFAFVLVHLAAAGPPDISEPRVLPGDLEVAPAAGKQWSPEIAAGAGMFLAVWVDARASANVLPENVTGGAAFDNENGTMNDIFAARLDAQGRVLDTSPIIVGLQTQNQALPDVAWNGQNWLVVWSGQEGIACCPDINVYAARVSPTGAVLDDPPIMIDTDNTGNGLYWPTVESDGANWLVVWRDLDQQAGIFTLDGARISPAGAILDPGGVRLRRDSFNSYPIDPDLAFAGDRYLLTWTENSGDVKGQLLTTALQPIGAVFQINLYSPSTGLNPRVATNGSDFLVAYWESRFDAFSQLRAARVSHQGQVLDPLGIEITEAFGYTNFDPAVAFDGAYYFIVFDHGAFNPDIHAARVTPQGAVLDFGGFLVTSEPNVQYSAATATIAGGGVVAIWKDDRNGGAHVGDIFGSSISRDAQVGENLPVSVGVPRQMEPSVAFAPDGYLIVFRSETALGVRILAQRVSAAGLAIDPEPIEVTAGDAIRNPAVDWNGSVFLAVWENGTIVEGRRLAPNAVPIDPAPFTILPGEMPDVAALGDLFFVVSSHENPHEIRMIKGARVRGADGAVLDPNPIVVGPSFSQWPRVAALGARWLAVWEQYPTHDNPRSNIYANFVTAAGVAGATFGVQVTSIPPERRPDIASAGDFALIVWSDGRTNPEREDIFGRRIEMDGVFLDGSSIPISTAANEQWDPQVAWDGERFVVEHWDSRQDFLNDVHTGDLFGVLVSPAGQPLDLDGFPVFNQPVIPEIQPAVAARGGTPGSALLAGAIFHPEPPYGSYRIGFRILDPPATSAVADAEAMVSRPFSVTAMPNPSSEPVSLMFDTPGTEGTVEVDVVVVDVTGREVRRFAAEATRGQRVSVVWDGRDAAGRAAPRGVYLARVRSGGAERSVKLVRR